MFDLKLPKLGFGLMRLPQNGDQIDISQLCKMVDKYMEAGLNYFDTAFMYHNGESEIAIHEALVKRYPRESFFLVDKLPIWLTTPEFDKEQLFQKQLSKTGVEYFDLYLLHSMDDNRYKLCEKEDCFNWAMKKKEEGKIKHFGISFHGTANGLDEILTKHPEIEIVQIQLNYADWDNPVVQSGKCYEVLRKHNKPILVMEPIKGGLLASGSNEVKKLMKDYSDCSMASWALRFAASLPNVVTVLSGMSNEEQMLDNLNTMTQFKKMNQEEFDILGKVIEILVNEKKVGCTDCKYCMDKCPMGIQIPEIFKLLNVNRVNNNDWLAKRSYDSMNEKASICLKCGACESVCPQHLNIIELLEEAKECFEGEN